MSDGTVREFAPAKINLTLHVTGRRADGYHLLDSLVAFAGVGDWIEVTPADNLTLKVTGPFASTVPEGEDNLVLRAARLLDPNQGARITLEKHLPPASGIGGGSSDAAATLRALARIWSCPLPSETALLTLGADLPVCMDPSAKRMRGIGDVLSPINGLPAADILLVNPGVDMPTSAVFRGLADANNAGHEMPLPGWPDLSALTRWLARQRNDLQHSAIAQKPVIGEVLDALQATDPLTARMSGSGATCFALYPADGHSARSARVALQAEHPNWWSAHAGLR